VSPEPSADWLILPSTTAQRRTALAVCGALAAFTLFALRLAPVQGPILPAYIAATVTLGATASLQTAIILLGPFAGRRGSRFTLLGMVFLYAGLMWLAYMLTFPAVFSAQGLLGAGPQTAVWLSVLWWAGLAVGVLSYSLASSPVGAAVHQPASDGRRLAGGLARLYPVLVAALLTFVTVQCQHLLPVLVQHGAYTALYLQGMLPAVWLANLAGLAVLLWRTRARTLLDLTLSVYLFIMVLGLTSLAASHGRYSVGWYLLLLDVLISAAGMLCVLMVEMHMLSAAAERFRTQISGERDHLSQIVEFLPEGLVLYDRDSRRVSMNRAATAIMGSELLSRPIGADYQALRQLDGTVLSYEELPIIRSVCGGEVVTAEPLLMRNSATAPDVPILLSTAPLHARDGTIQGGIAVLTDISALRALEQERERLLAQMQATLASSTHAFVVSDAQGRATYMNVEAERLLGPASAVGGTTPGERVASFRAEMEPGTPLRQEATATARALRGETVRDLIVATNLPGQSGRAWLLVSAAPIRTAAGQIVGAVNSFVDITQQHEHQQEQERLLASEQRARAELAAERDRLQRILDVLPEAVVIYNADSLVTMLNGAARALFGAGIVAKPRAALDFAIRLPDGTPVPADQFPTLRALRAGETTRAARFVMRSALSGEDVTFLSNVAPLRDADGAIVGAVGVSQDISALVALERQRDHVLSIVTHDLRNPITSIVGTSQLLQRRLDQVAEAVRSRFAQGLLTIETASRTMNGQIAELLDFARTQAGRPLELALEVTDVVALVRRVLAQHQSTTDQHSLELRAAEEAIVATVDPQRLERALANLLVNAIKYSPNGGPIVVAIARTGPNEEWLELAVSDSGLGIPAADLPHVFEQYFRAGNVAASIPGTGIGLAGVRHVIERHGGTVAVESSEGVGTTVTIRLPLGDGADHTRQGEAIGLERR